MTDGMTSVMDGVKPTLPACSAAPGQPSAVPMLGTGVVRHRRLRPAGHAFEYPTYFLMLPLRSLSRPASAGAAHLVRNRRGLLSFYDADHGDGRADALAWLDEVLQREGVADALGEVWLHTYPRVAGYVFKPVSFWYCHRVDGTLAAVLVEVNNTFGERHCYLLSGPGLAFGREQVARKVFYVSPFCRVQGRYRFRFMHAAGRTVARVDHDDDEGPLLQTSVSGHLVPLNVRTSRKAFFGTPLMTLAVVLRIHWHALRLWLKQVPFVNKPAPPKAFVSR